MNLWQKENSQGEKFLSDAVMKRLYIFLPYYSPHLNIAETYWRKANTNSSSHQIIFPLPNTNGKSRRFSMELGLITSEVVQ